jgi:hypothetical protein
MDGAMLSERRPEWDAMGPLNRKAFLLEKHEVAHHALMFSTPAGALIWRINQVISRDAGFLLRCCNELGIAFEGLESPAEIFRAPLWQQQFLDASTSNENFLRRAYCLKTFSAMERLVQFRSILIGKSVRQEYVDFTVGDFLALVNFCYAYLQDRCDCPFVTIWKSRRSNNEKLFQANGCYNINDIAECHAISTELFVLRALNDVDSLKERAERVRVGPYNVAFEKTLETTATEDQFGFSPFYIQICALMSLCGDIDTVDINSSKERYIEDEFPWQRFSEWTLSNTRILVSSLQNLVGWCHRPLFGQGSKWIRFADWEPLNSLDNLQNYFSSLASLGLDLQIYSMHKGAALNYRFLFTALAESAPPQNEIPIAKLTNQEWLSETSLAIPLIEYDNGIFFPGLDLDEIYKQDHPIRKMRAFRLMIEPGLQLIAFIVNGTSTRNQFAQFYGRQIPKLDVLRGKLSEHFTAPGLADSVCDILKNAHERGLTAR